MGKFRDWETSDKFNVIVFIHCSSFGLPKDVFTYITPLTHMSMKNFCAHLELRPHSRHRAFHYAAAGLVSAIS